MNITQVFNLGRLLGPLRRKPLTPYDLALRDLSQGRFEEALARLDELFAQPDMQGEQRAAIANKRGVALISLHRREEAARAFAQSLEIRPRFAPALVNAGNLQLEAGEIEKAIANYEAALKADETYAPAHHNLAVAYKKLGRTADSVRALRSAHKFAARK